MDLSRKSKPRPSRRHAPHLEVDKVVSAALQLLNEVGFEGLTLRKLAGKLDVKAAALYWHFENKQDLIDRVACKIIEEELTVNLPAENRDWRQIVTDLAYGTRSALRRYRDGALVIASADLSKSGTARARDEVMRSLFDAGFPAELILSSMFAAERYALGCVLEEQADPLQNRSTEYEYQQGVSTETSIEYPAIARAYQELPQTADISSEARFQAGLDLLLDGISARMAKYL